MLDHFGPLRSYHRLPFLIPEKISYASFFKIYWYSCHIGSLVASLRQGFSASMKWLMTEG
jgi:hypothetical protein